MTPHFCHTCEVLKEIYWLKASRFVLAARPAESRPTGRRLNEDDLQALKNDAMDSLRTLLRHMNSCYGFPLERAA
jgi:hypothetical protein